MKKHSILIAICCAVTLTACDSPTACDSSMDYFDSEILGPGVTALHVAAFQGGPDAIRKLLDKGVPVDFPAKNGDTALMVAADYGHEDDVAILLKAGADPNARGYRGHTPLMLAVTRSIGCRSKAGVVKMLLDAGADVNAKNDHGATALMYNMFGNNPLEIAKILLAAGADASARDNEGRDALDFIDGPDSQTPELRQLLISAGAGKLTNDK